MNRSMAAFLVVEDNELDVEKFRRGLRRAKAPNRIVHAKDGYEALDVLRGTGGQERLLAPYVILLDLNMPRMNGLEFLRELRKDEELAYAPVLVLTTSDLSSDVAAACQGHVSGYFVKSEELQPMYKIIEAISAYWNRAEFPIA